MRTGMKKQEKNRRNAIQIMSRLIGLVKPLLHIMAAAVILGTAGYLCAIFLTILACGVLLHGVLPAAGGVPGGSTAPTLFAVMGAAALLRGLFHYAEQYCNHFIAFKLLAIIRHRVFAALRKLCPAKLEGRDKGNLISIITTDIELLEVFYAHTISPVAIAAAVSLIMTAFIGSFHIYAGLLALVSYAVVGILLPLWNGKLSGAKGMEFRTGFGELNSFVLDSLRGLDETIQFGQGESRKQAISRRSGELGDIQKQLSRMEGKQRSLTNLMILLASLGMLFLCIFLYRAGGIGFDGVLLCTAAMMGSFGPVVALSNLSNNLNQTLASAERVLSILEEKPLVEEIGGGIDSCADAKIAGKEADGFAGAAAEHVTFSYEEENILEDYSIQLGPGTVTGIHGASGSGKSTLLKLLMRFWDVDGGRVLVSGEDVRRIPTGRLRAAESYVTQETYLFHDSIANNIAVGKTGASREEIMEAARKASVHDFIMSLPKGYDTGVGELGDTLSGGERQRIGLARAFLHDAPLLLLDEPTSNLDSLNEGVILKSLRAVCSQKTVILVSHRKSTMKAADTVFEMDGGRIS